MSEDSTFAESCTNALDFDDISGCTPAVTTADTVEAANGITNNLLDRFTSLWDNSPKAASFKCKLKRAVGMDALMQHLQRQEFHIISALANVSPSVGNFTIHFCNADAYQHLE